MKYEYDLNNPIEREMFLNKQKKQWERVNNKDLTLQQGFIEVMKEYQKDMEYFYNRDKMEKEIEQQVVKQLQEQLPEFVENTVEDLLKAF